ncbi:hypothetical protein PVAND_016390 [Polypedilum vanderplanki]|uniref:Uncharacterized protein n=1 Tax=Polypedilum vanderplanki TaxID=319348 RepID=A0A9J6BFG5_POLVA|nr:hypothetical protein PVAND_016390 [Polypedilum vanderplanki]
MLNKIFIFGCLGLFAFSLAQPQAPPPQQGGFGGNQQQGMGPPQSGMSGHPHGPPGMNQGQGQGMNNQQGFNGAQGFGQQPPFNMTPPTTTTTTKSSG